MRRIPSTADLRAFRWHLAPLERKLKMNIEAARSTHAALRRQARQLQQVIERLARQRSEELKLARIGAERLDPTTQTRALRHLVRLSTSIEEGTSETAALQRRIDTAARACTDAEQQLARLERMRDAAQSAFAAAQLRAAEKNADVAWLAARVQAQRAVEWSSGSAE
jgi:hypothetical protein